MCKLTGIELNVIGDLGGCNVQLDGIVGLNDRIRITDCATVVRNQEWDFLRSQNGLADLAQLVLGLLDGNPMNGETSLYVVDQTELFAGLFNGDNIWKRTKKYIIN